MPMVKTETHIDPFIPRAVARAKFLGGISRTTLRKWEASGVLPPCIRLSQCTQGWRQSTLESFLAAKQRDAQP
ncbi:helix-turn-helix transcriptional regulator [Variovorax terrae]|uniref:AlpA family phage regulatory protein n=1 Tax=Variovorax terrae TaxID=2923278 RepID=A0A9X1VY56_9BURK|nr:hypothetical protein [Variovorax terrae]MCJ0764162.1 hypothetical protein [Variovorax terrae]